MVSTIGLVTMALSAMGLAILKPNLKLPALVLIVAVCQELMI